MIGGLYLTKAPRSALPNILKNSRQNYLSAAAGTAAMLRMIVTFGSEAGE